VNAKLFTADGRLAASLGCNTIRTFLQFSAPLEPAGLLKPDGSLTAAYHEKIEQLLAAAWRHGIRVVVCFEFSSQWLAATGAADRWQRALGNVVAKYRDDGRVLMWDFDRARRRGARWCRRRARVVPP
jgi:hypothetical protein